MQRSFLKCTIRLMKAHQAINQIFFFLKRPLLPMKAYQATIQISFLDASTHLYKKVRRSVGSSVRHAFFFRMRENARFLLPRSLEGRGWRREGVGGDEGAGEVM